MGSLDWILFAGVVVGLISVVLFLRRYTASVADFLAANRSAGRYLLTVADGVSGVGAITIIAVFELHYSSGFVPEYWQLMLLPIGLIISLSGWVIYRFRQTRAFTLAQFLEMRYSRRFRIFAGTVCFLSGIINYGIFPAVTARFFIHMMGIPDAFALGPVELQTYPVTMAVMLSLALFFTLGGGQVTIMITDFIQGQLVNVVMVLILGFLLFRFDWQSIITALETAPKDASLLNPFETAKATDFNFWYYAIAVFGSFYGVMAWQGSQAYNASARNPHEARMAKVLGNWRTAVINILPMLLPICAFVVMSHPEFREMASAVTNHVQVIDDDQAQKQLLTPTVLIYLLPAGLLGLFVAVMWAAAISTDNTYLHSWGSILVQDIIIPLYGKPLSPKAHMLALRLAIVGVAVFGFFFSLLYKQNDYIFMFMSMTGAIFVGGAGSVIIGGLYWKRGTTTAAWVSMLLGAGIPITCMIARMFDPNFFLNGQQIWFAAMASASVSYVVISLLGKQKFNLDRMLHRGEYAGDVEAPGRPIGNWLTAIKQFGVGPDFSKSDRFIYFLTAAIGIAFFGAFIWALIVHLTSGTDASWWASFWWGFLVVGVVKAVIVTIWFFIGGARDIVALLRDLSSAVRDAEDDGFVEEHEQ